jgi:hypothetical protein
MWSDSSEGEPVMQRQRMSASKYRREKKTDFYKQSQSLFLSPMRSTEVSPAVNSNALSSILVIK